MPSLTADIEASNAAKETDCTNTTKPHDSNLLKFIRGRRYFFPSAYYDGGELMVDPVVGKDGMSRNRTSSHDHGDMEDEIAYTNRALKALIDHELDFAAAHFSDEKSSSKTNNINVVRGFRSWKLKPQSASNLPSTVINNVPEPLLCPITRSRLFEAVITPTGYTFERQAVETWIEQHGTCPITREPLRISDVRPNRAIRHVLEVEQPPRRKRFELYFAAAFSLSLFAILAYFSAT